MSNQLQADVVVLGSGPGGYTAAFRAADLGKKVILIERYDNLGGVCLNVGCIPSKALLHAAKVVEEAAEMKEYGIDFGHPKVDTKKLCEWKNKVVSKLTGGLKMLAKQRKVEVVQGVGKFSSKNEILVEGKNGKQTIQFENAIIAVGSRPVKLPFLPDDPRIIDSTGALELVETKCKMLVIGGGIIGLEMATVYQALGAEITIVELMDQIIPGCDKDIVTPLYKRVQKRYQAILLKTKVTKVDAKKDGLYVTFEGENAPKEPEKFDRILCAVGRIPNGKDIAADKAGVKVDERGFITVDKQQRTNVANIFAIGDVAGNPMLAHKAIPEGRVAAEVIAGLKHYFDPKCIPSVAYTDPEVVWIGVTENEAKAKNIKYGKGVFPWAASGRSLSIGRDDGLTKLIIDEATNRVIGAGIVGPNAGELAAEIGLAIEMGCDVEDISLTIHPHPTLSETVALAAEVFEGTITDLYLPKKKVDEKKA
jgi:dihydrolipoamide dehydrogenase